jgi:hypothetical protein
MSVRRQKLVAAIVLFLVLFTLFHLWKPGFAYNEAGGFRPFGLGYRDKTIFPRSRKVIVKFLHPISFAEKELGNRRLMSAYLELIDLTSTLIRRHLSS